MGATPNRLINVYSGRDRFLYLRGKTDRNNTSYWLTELYNAKIKVPETFILRLTVNEHRILNRQSRTNEELTEEIACTKELVRRLLLKLRENEFKSSFSLVLKNNLSSSIDLLDEYVPLPSNCVLDLKEEELLPLVAGFVSKNKGKVNELVIQGYYDNQDRPLICEHIVLNTRARVYYSFETNEVLEIFNAWDSFKVKTQLKESAKSKEQMILDSAKLEKSISFMNDEIKKHHYFLKAYLEEHLKSLKFKGQWMIDVLITKRGYYVVEMKKEANEK